MSDDTPTAIDDAVAKARIKAMAWLARNTQVTIGQMITYLFMVKREHITPIINAWKDHGMSAELVAQLVERFAPVLLKSKVPEPPEAA